MIDIAKLNAAMEKIERIETTLNEMAVGSCGSKWDVVVWRVTADGWKIGDRIYDLDSAVYAIACKRGLLADMAL